MKKILLILTGGTICTSVIDGKRTLNTHNAVTMLVEKFNKSGSEYTDFVSFEIQRPVNILSENMNISVWNNLISYFKNIKYENFDGIIIAHGTDTLAYTSALFSLLLNGINIPVIFVSSNAPLGNIKSNGNDNFKYAVEGICDGSIKQGVWVAYKNISNGKMSVHKGACIKQAQDYSDDFYSFDFNYSLPDMLIKKIDKLKDSVLYINPYVGMDYNLYNLKKVRAVLHGTYHSGTVESNSFQLFAKKCEEEGIPVFVSPCKNMYSEIYSSVSDVLKHGVIDVYGTTSEFLYCKILVAFSLFDDIKMAVGFVKDN